MARILPLIFAMGCSAALNPSTTVTNQAVQSGQTTVLSWTDAGTGPHHVWLNYEGNATTGVSMGPVTMSVDGVGLITGTLVLKQGGAVVRTDQLLFQPGKPPLIGQNIRKELKLSSGKSTWLYDIPSSPAGTVYELSLSNPQVNGLLKSVALDVSR